MWRYGKEAWCNMEGRYVHIVADMRHEQGTYIFTICALGFMGTQYVHPEPVLAAIEVF